MWHPLDYKLKWFVADTNCAGKKNIIRGQGRILRHGGRVIDSENKINQLPLIRFDLSTNCLEIRVRGAICA